MTKVKKRTESITLRLEPDFKQRILKYSYDNQINITDMIEKALLILMEEPIDNHIIDDKR